MSRGSKKRGPAGTRKGAAAARRPVTVQFVTKAILERRSAVTRFVNYAESIARDQGKSLRIAQRAGVLTHAGHLTSHYKPGAAKK
jgi:ribosomal protein L19E